MPPLLISRLSRACRDRGLSDDVFFGLVDRAPTNWTEWSDVEVWHTGREWVATWRRAGHVGPYDP